MKKQTKNKSAFSAQHPAPSALNYLRCKVKKSASYVLHFILIALMVVSLNSCKRDMSEKIKERKNESFKPQFQTTTSSNYLVFDSLSILSINIMEAMSELETSDYCSLKQIINSENDTEEKMNAISTNAALGNVYISFVNFNNFVINHNFTHFLEDSEATFYFNQRLLIDLDIEAPNNDPCERYKKALSRCIFELAGCTLIASASGPAAALGFAICIGSFSYCVEDAMDTWPNCVSNGGRFDVIINPIIYNNSNC